MLAAALAADQGTAVRFEFPDEPGLAAVEATWRGLTVPLFKDGNWVAVLGVDLDDDEGEHSLSLTLEYADGTDREVATQLGVTAREYRTTHLTVEPKYVELSPENQERAAREAAELNAIYDRITPDALWTQPFDVPIPGVTGGRNFGHRRVFNEQPRNPHSGADLKAATGTPILSTNRGRVVLAKNLFFSGNAVFVDHGLGIYSAYLHLSRIDVEPGQMLERGEVVGLVGATGRVTGPHLHWGFRVQGARVDPFSMLEISAD